MKVAIKRATIKVGKYNPNEIEPEILKFWEKNNIYKKAKDKNKGKVKWYFLDGPPYTSGKVHIGTAWNKALKDSIIRYKRMRGFDVWDRAGYDMHGLPTENAAQKKLKLKDKKDIEKFGVNNFIRECRKLCVENMKVMNKDFQRLGVWMDFDNAYQSITLDFMESEWWLIKRAHEKGRLYEGLRTMTWCPATESALAKHELEYKTVTDESIFVKFKVKGSANEFLVIWTTTPWTIPLNLAVMVNPEIEYVKAKVGDEVWIVASSLAAPFIKGVVEKDYEVIETFKGAELEGVGYEHPCYDELKEHFDRIKSESEKTHTVLLNSEYVDTSAGSGLVHVAPGCGPEDYEVGHANGIGPWNPIDERGVFPEGMGIFSNLVARTDDKKFTELLEKSGCLIAKVPYKHDYPHGERSHAPVIFRTTKQWFFKIEDLKEDMINENKQVFWRPEAAFNAFESWLKNLRDNSISKQRYWGTPLPIWRNTENPDDYIVVGSASELESLSGKKVDDLHIPTVDKIEIKKNGKTYRRVPDVLDVWVDAGTASWNCLGYPQNKNLFNEYFPADFILEGKDQIRGWFNLLMVASTLAFDRSSFKNCYMHGFVQDAAGRKMSKSLGNYILPEEVIKNYGADTLRFYTIGGANPGLDLNYNFDDMKIKYRNLSIIWNVHKYILDLARNLKLNPVNIKPELDIEEKYIISRMHSTIREVTRMLDEYRLNEVPGKIEELYLELSRTYMQLVRDKSSGEIEEQKTVLHTVYTVLLETTKMFAIISPFISEKMFLNLKESFKLKEQSIHHFNWPAYDTKKIDAQLEKDMEVAKKVIQSILNSREKISLGVRWPLKNAVVVSEFDDVRESVKRMKKIIMRHTNVKDIQVAEELKGIRLKLKADNKTLGPVLGKDLPTFLAELALQSPEAIQKAIKKDSKYTLKVGKKSFAISQEHVKIEKEVPEHLVESEFSHGVVYLDKTRTEELESEGFAREIMRRVQDARKKAGLEKKDKVDLFIHADDYIKDMIAGFHEQIMDKCGAVNLKLSSEPPSADYKEQLGAKIKGKKLVVYINKK